MSALPLEIYTVATVREIDRAAIELAEIGGFALMTRAAEAALHAARQQFPEARRWQVVCGSGNNAGDGYLVARLAAAEGIGVSVLAVSDPAQLRGDAQRAWRECLAAGIEVRRWTGTVDNSAGLLVDAMLGSGLQRELAGDFAAAVACCNNAAAPILALDVPTGLHGDSGRILGAAIHAELTVTFVGLKSGLFLAQGAECCGKIDFSDLGIPAACYAGREIAYRRIEFSAPGTCLPRRRRDAHKGDFGHVLVVGGGRGMPGAALLCGEGALRAGAGRVSIATCKEHAVAIVRDRPELMVHGVDNASELRALLAASTVVAAGPGLGRERWARELLAELQADTRPAVWDADALNLLAERPTPSANRIITPHPGEAATLLGASNAEVQADRPGALRRLQQIYGGVAVLKGAGSLISGEDGVPWLCTRGNPGMAAPGMGDVLTGMIAGLLAQGLSLRQAAISGVEWHAAAGDRAAAAGERGLIASDLLAEVRSVVNA